MKCVDCANHQYEYSCNTLWGVCYADVLYTPHSDCEEIQCERFRKKSGITCWDSMGKEEQKRYEERVYEFAKERYSGAEIEEFVNFVIAKAKTTGSNSCQWESEVS